LKNSCHCNESNNFGDSCDTIEPDSSGEFGDSCEFGDISEFRDSSESGDSCDPGGSEKFGNSG
jgi:hypothetical protein